MADQNVKLSSPWIIFYKKVVELFKYDPEIEVVFNEEFNKIELYVDNDEKAEALTKLLPTEKTFGNVTVAICVIPKNGNNENKLELFEKAFKCNPVLSYTKSEGDGFGIPPRSFVVFQKKVVQFFTDDLSDVNSVCSTLYQDIAKEVFVETPGLYFCTNTEDNQ